MNKKTLKVTTALVVAVTAFFGVNGVTRASEDLRGNSSYIITEQALKENAVKFSEPTEQIVRILNRGKLKAVASNGETVDELLKKNNINLTEESKLNVKLTDIATSEVVVEINDIKTVSRTETTTQPFNTVNVKSGDYEEGTSKVTTDGVEGKIETVYQDEVINGKVVKSTKISEKEVVKKVDKVVTQGTASKQASSYNNVSDESAGASSKSNRTFSITFYTDLPEENGGNVYTASGERLSAGMVASNVYSLGTRIYLEGYGTVRVADRGGSSFNSSSRLDLFVPRLPGESNARYKSRVNSMGRVTVRGYVK